MRPGAPRCVVLFDLDGTLVESAHGSPSAGLLSMNEAARQITGASGLGDPQEFAGRTDVQIARMLLAAGGEADSSKEAERALLHLYLAQLERNIVARPYAALGEPRAAVAALEETGAVIGLGTGNLPRGAALKLASAGIADLFDLRLGGYGDDGDTRTEVLAAGARRCDPGGALPVVIVGDTPRDVSAAHGIGAPCIGVPFYNNTREVLAAAGADAVIAQVDGGIADVVGSLIARSRR
jgi:phosphoglycolate phosphatase-like HAD superfamily hydrolase